MMTESLDSLDFPAISLLLNFEVIKIILQQSRVPPFYPNANGMTFSITK
jgi:hypothetical protein